MAYTPTIWSENDIITAEKLNNIENGIDNVLNLGEVNLTEGVTHISATTNILNKYLNNNIKYIVFKYPESDVNIVLYCFYQSTPISFFCSMPLLKELLGSEILCTVSLSEAKDSLDIAFVDPSTEFSIPEIYDLGEITLEDNSFSKTITSEDYAILKNVKFLTFQIKQENEKFATDYLLYKGDYLHHTTSGGYPTDSISFCNLKCLTDDSNNLYIENIIAKASCYFGPSYTYNIDINFTTYTVIPTNSTT